jgi:HD-GYP domain-containing protein (c-di-GMP phosphodiesterase class II)
LAHIPVTGLPEPTPGVLIVEQDITEALSEREQRSQTLQQLVQVIVARIDGRDPHASEHSARVATIAAGTARSMGLDNTTIDTTETAARLMNLGKMDIPAEWLTRSGTLKAEERDTIRSSMATSAELLSGIAFNGPVVETLRQAQEFVDGSGPLGKRGEQILISARIIAAANALVGMLSTRAWREGMSLDEAMVILHESSGKQFDRKVISALANYLDNLGGSQMLAATSSPQRSNTGS